MPEPTDNSHGPLTARQQAVLTWVFTILIAATFSVLMLSWIVLVILSFEDIRHGLIKEHFLAFAGLPAAGAAAFILVFLYRQTSGPVQIEAFTMRFKGAAGPVVLWVICFLAIVSAAKMVW